MKKPYDQNLREAVEEIRKICLDRDIAAHVVLVSPTHSEFAMIYDIPKWSVISFEKAPDGGFSVRIRAKKSVHGDDEKLLLTTHMLTSFHDLFSNGLMAIETLLRKLRDHVAILHVNKIGVAPDSYPGDGK